jgi:DNA modification methylase
MGGKKADLVFTDPPYGVGKDIANDDLCGKEFDNFNAGWIAALPAKKNCGMVCYHSTRTFPSALNEAVKAGWSFERMLWYYRPDKFPTHSWNHWMMVSQAIMLFSVGAVDYADTESDQDCYRLTSSDLGDGHGHPTEKMAEHCQRVMQHFKASIVYDPFLGSGTTMVACQNLNRKCYGVEISPGYCAVILERMITAFPEIDIRRAE